MEILGYKHNLLTHACLMFLLTTGMWTSAYRMWHTIITDFRLHQMARVLEANGLTSLFDAENVTVFLPTSEGFFQFDRAYYGIGETDVEKWRELFAYGSMYGRVRMSELPQSGKMVSRLSPALRLYVNRFESNSEQIITINGATIIEADIITDNGVLHIVDKLIAPIGSSLTIAKYLQQPELPDLEFRAIILAAVVVPTLTEKTDNSSSLQTSFSPNDSYLYPMPEHGQIPLFHNETILVETYLAHIVEDEALFLPASLDYLPPKKALFGSLRFYRRDDGRLYVSNYGVHARVIRPNIPTVNGVIHVIDNLLRYVYQNALESVAAMDDTLLFSQLLSKLPESRQYLVRNTTVTLFVPTNWAFSKIPLYMQDRLTKEDIGVEVAQSHVIVGSKVESDIWHDGQVLPTMNNKTLTIREIDGEFYLETEDRKVRSRVEVTDIGVTNGVVHLVKNVLHCDQFTIWEAISDTPQLRSIHDFLSSHFQEMKALLNMSTNPETTVFLPSNEVMDLALDYLNILVTTDSTNLLKALQGHVITGRYSSSAILGEKTHRTVSGKTVVIRKGKTSSEITITGGHVTTTLSVRDIYCSNGVLHIIDDLLHIPTRTIAEEIKHRDSLRYMAVLLQTINDEQYNLDDRRRNYTLFVANNDAFSALPWDTVSELMRNINWTTQVLRAHVVPGEIRTLEEIPSKVVLPAEHNVIFLVRRQDKVFAINNNMAAEVVTRDIPAVNGWIHVIDRILTVPYSSLRDLLNSGREDISLFHEIMSDLPEYTQMVTQSTQNITMFIPSTRYIKSLAPLQFDRIKGNTEILRKLLHGHLLPNVRLDDVFLRKFPEQDYSSRSAFNVSFSITRNTGETFIDAGFDLLPLDVIGRSTGCTDGVIYVIDGFLNYSPFSVLERLKREPGLSSSFEHMTGLVSDSELELLNNPDMAFTFLMPDDYALDYVTFNNRLELHSLPAQEQHRIFWRHAVNGTTLYYEDLQNIHVTREMFSPEISVNYYNDNVYVRYKNINSMVKEWNLIASNGVIHILTKFLYDFRASKDPSDPTAAPKVTPSTHVPGTQSTILGGLQGGVALRASLVLVGVVQLLGGALVWRVGR